MTTIEKELKNILNTELEDPLTPHQHIGHILLECFKKRGDEEIFQIDGATNEKVTYKEIMHQSIKLAIALKAAGLKPGDVMFVSGLEHVHLFAPLYAAVFLGLPLSLLSVNFEYEKIKHKLEVTQPKIVFIEFADKEKYDRCAKELGVDLKTIFFSDGDYTIEKFINTYYDDTPLQAFRPNVFDIDKIPIFLKSSSGTSAGFGKVAVLHQRPMFKMAYMSGIHTIWEKSPRKLYFLLNPIFWGSSHRLILNTPVLGMTLLTSSRLNDIECTIDIINKYWPNITRCYSSYISNIFKSTKYCDLTCFDEIVLSGNAVTRNFADILKSRTREDTALIDIYGMVESMGLICRSDLRASPSCGLGRPPKYRPVKLVNINGTGEEITEPYVEGELVCKGPLFSSYYKDPVGTADAFTRDGWFKSGDLFYRDEKYNYYFKERMKFVFDVVYENIKYKFSPTKIEAVIDDHPSVLESCVTASDYTDIEALTACVVLKPGHEVSAQEIQQFVADTLHGSMHLRGGVRFFDALPKTPSGKLARHDIQKLIK